MDMDNLIDSVNRLLEQEEFGKSVPILETLKDKLQNLVDIGNQSEEILRNLAETDHNLALSYGIIGEHNKSLPLWKSIIEKLFVDSEIDEILEAHYNAALSAEQARDLNEFIAYLNSGLKVAKANNAELWEATFEHELGVYAFDNQDYTTASAKLTHAIELSSKLDDLEGLVSSYFYLGHTFENQNNHTKAKELYEKALNIAKHEDIRDEVTHERALVEERLSIINKTQLQKKLQDFK
jgi:tetratricopeptide (TPR) repeat protein